MVPLAAAPGQSPRGGRRPFDYNRARMKTAWPDQSAAFARLEQRLAARRLAKLDLRSRAVFLALAALLAGFFYWQVRVPLDGFVRQRGAEGGVLWLGVALLGWAGIAGAITWWRQDALLGRLPGSEWLALPVDPARVMRHLLAEARLPAAAVIPLALVTIVAGVGLLPVWWLALLAAAFVVAWLECTRIAAAAARRLVLVHAAHPALAPGVRLLASSRRPATLRRRPPARWRSEPAWRSLQRLDLALTRVAAGPRTRMAFALALVGLGLAAWFAEADALQRRALAFAAFLPASSLLGAWAIHRVCADPAPAMRPLPIGLWDAWRARIATIALVATAAVLLNVALAHGLGVGARLGTALVWEACALAVATLGLQYGLTLHPRADAAENLYFGWLGVVLMASWMIPLLGWAVLVVGLAHSGLRLRRWRLPEAP